MAVRIARDRSRFGSRASPASWTACSKPCSPNTTPPVSAAKTPWKPNGMKPPPAWKLAGLNCSAATTPTARTGTAVFQITTIDVALGQELRAGEVHRGEEHHQDDGDDEARAVQEAGARRRPC